MICVDLGCVYYVHLNCILNLFWGVFDILELVEI